MMARRTDHQKQNKVRDRHYDLGLICFDENKWHEALGLFNQTLAFSPNNIDALYMRGRTYLNINNVDAAKEDFNKLITHAPITQHAHFLRGLGLIQLHAYDEALIELEECLKMDREDPSPSIYQGWSLFNLKKYDQALFAFKKAIKIAPTFYTFYHYGRALYSMHFYEKALLNFDECLKRNPTYFYAYYRKGMALCSLKRKKEARAVFEICMKIAPGLYVSWYLYAMGLFLLKNYTQCLLACDESLKRRNDFSGALILRKETEAKLKLINDHTKEKYIMLNRIDWIVEQNSIQSLQTKVTEQEKKITDLQMKHSTEILKLNTEISELKIQMKAVDEQEQQLIQLKMQHLEERQKLNETMAALKNHESIVEEQNTKITDLQNQNTILTTEIAQLKSQRLTKDIVLNKILLDGSLCGNLDGINGALSLGANINAQDEEGRTALHLAIFNKQKKAAKLLLEKSIILAKSPNIFLIPDKYGLTPMQYAAQNDLINDLPWLYNQGKKIGEFYKDLNEFDKVYNVGTAAAKKCLANIKLLDSAKTESLDGIENTEGVVDALSKGADINFIGRNGTALHVAIFCKHPAITQLLIEHGADPTILHYNETALDMAITLNNQALVSLLATPFLIFSAEHGSIEGMEKALDVNALLIGKDLYGQTALHKAVLQNKIAVIKYLLKKHVDARLDICQADNEKTTPYGLTKKLNLTVTTKKGEIIDTGLFLGTRYGKYVEKYKNLSKSQFSFINIIGGRTLPPDQPRTIPTIEKEGHKQRLKN